MTEPMHIQLFGDFQLFRGDAMVTTVQSPQEQSLLAYLVLNRRTPQSRQHLSFLFWPDSPESRARSQLRKVLYRLRQDLPDAETFIYADTHAVQWRPSAPFTLDVAEYERALAQAEKETSGDRAEAVALLERAVDLYAGDLLPNCYDDWVLEERALLSQRFVRALERLQTLLEGQREYERAIRYAQRLQQHDPLYEPCYRILMRLHALTGNRAAALRVYHECVTVLERELDVTPSPDTQQAYERLLQAPTPAAPAVSRQEMLATSAPLVGRQREWVQLLDLWQAADSGAPHLVLIEGEAGIGKTRLAEELVRWAQQQGTAVAIARCYAAEGTLAYAPVAQWLRARPLPALEPVWRREVARLLPELLTKGGSDPTPPRLMSEGWQRQRLFEALARAVLSGRQPLLLVLDDVQWCDQDTLEWLHYLLRSNPAARLLVVGTVRLEDVQAEDVLVPWLRAAQRDMALSEIALGPLDEKETLALAANIARQELDAELAGCLYVETEGNPLFVVEMARAGRLSDTIEPACPPQGLPPRVQATIEGRLAQLSAEARALAGLAASVGRSFTYEVLSGASELGQDTLLRALDELWQRQVVREQGEEAYDFTHDKLREVAYASLSGARQRRLHRQVALALEAAYADELDVVSRQIAAQYDRGGQPREAIPYYLRAAKVARQVYANQEAVNHYQRALALTASSTSVEEAEWRVQALDGLGETYLWVGNLSAAEERLQEAIALGKRASLAPRRLAKLHYWLATALSLQYRYEDQLRVGEEGLALLGKDTDSTEAVLISGVTALAYYETEGNRERFRELVHQVSASLERLPYVEGLGPVYERVFDLHLRSKNPQEAVRWLGILERQAAMANDLDALAIAHHRMGRATFYQGDLGGALPHMQQAVGYALQTGNISQLGYRLFWLALLTLLSGDLDGAEAHAHAAVDAVRNLDIPSRLAYMYWVLGLVLLCRGRKSEAAEALEQALALRAIDRQPEVTMFSHQLLGWAYLEWHDRAAALQQFRSAVELSTPECFATWHAPEMKAYALAFLNTLSGLEEAYADPATFRAFCRQLPHRDTFSGEVQRSPDLAQFALVQWFLEPAAPVHPMRSLLHETFSEPASPGWAWHDPFGDCRGKKSPHALHGGLEIHAANGRDLWHTHWGAPRFLCPLSSVWGSTGAAASVPDLALQVTCTPVSGEKPPVGGLLLWIDRANYLRLDRGMGGTHEITFLGCVTNRDLVIGRGRLPPEVSDAPLERAYLRLEWCGGQVHALCSADGQAWFTVGHVPFPFNKRAQFGVYAIGTIDRTIYHGAYPDGTAIRFESFQCWELRDTHGPAAGSFLPQAIGDINP